MSLIRAAETGAARPRLATSRARTARRKERWVTISVLESVRRG
jgi:hypothetical protein